MRIKAGFSIRDIAGEKVIIIRGSQGADLTRLVSLNSSAEWLYRQLEGAEFDTCDVAELLVRHYDIDRGTATRDAALWAERLSGLGIIEE